MKVQQFVMAYQVEQDRLRAMLPQGFTSLRPVLRINAELRDESTAYVEFNVPVEARGKRGWLNIAHWEGGQLTWKREGSTVTFTAPFLHISFTGVGIAGGCPAEKDNDGCFFLGEVPDFRPAESIAVNKEFCDCRFAWRFTPEDAQGVSQGKTLPAYPTDPAVRYAPMPLTPENAAAIPCLQVLGTYTVCFER